MSPDQVAEFESMAVSNTFDGENRGQQDTIWSIWALTPRVFEKEAEDIAIREYQEKAVQRVDQNKVVVSEAIEDLEARCKSVSARPKETILAQWDPELYRSKIWPLICFFGTSFPALHLISWFTIFPTLVEQWLWRGAFVPIITMLIFMHFERVFFRCGGFLTIISIVSPALYLMSRVVTITIVMAAFRRLI
ncbi:hypothetical protein G7Y89_g9678 [Cudoniella acicularis]|uniref:Uncharacterized protein n=1 Tax=Cudoniella acicularis TaxID=354080 RepID=A0A8H4RF72_9HELO|nr:hypothetical protein G7Y89_g9678 [Cudoniella acicularis]